MDTKGERRKTFAGGPVFLIRHRAVRDEGELKPEPRVPQIGTRYEAAEGLIKEDAVLDGGLRTSRPLLDTDTGPATAELPTQEKPHANTDTCSQWLVLRLQFAFVTYILASYAHPRSDNTFVYFCFIKNAAKVKKNIWSHLHKHIWSFPD